MDDHALLRFITSSLAGGSTSGRFDLGTVSGTNALLVWQTTGIEIGGFSRTLSASEVRHIFKSHGDPARESARNQLAIRKADLAQIVPVIDAANAAVVKGDPRGRKPRRLVYISEMNGNTVECVETLHPARRTVAVKTMRKW